MTNEENINSLILPTNFEDHISLDLKKAVRNLVSKKPDLDVKQVQEKVEIAATSFINPTDIASTSGIAMGVALASLANPLLGIGIGASLLATKFIKNGSVTYFHTTCNCKKRTKLRLINAIINKL